MSPPKKVAQRIKDGIKRFRPILEEARSRDVNEADTVTIVKGVLSDVFGWDPFFEVTAEYAVRGTYVDLATTIDGDPIYLIEVKAIGSDLRQNHLRQVVNYAANQGVEWVVLTNGATWQAHRITFGKPIMHEQVFEVDLVGDAIEDGLVDCAFTLTKEGVQKSAISRFHEERQALSKWNVAGIIRDEPVLREISRELRRAYPKLKPTLEEIRAVVENEVLKREVVEGERAAEALKAMKKARRPLRRRRALKATPAPPPAAAAETTPPEAEDVGGL